MPNIPEPINHYLSKILGIRLISKTDFDFFYNALKESMENLERQQTQTIFKYLPMNPESKSRIKDILQLLRPKRAVNEALIRLGNNGDGGYVCLDNFHNIKTAISLGISDDVSWDLDVVDRGMRVLQYDYSVDGPPIKNNSFIFHKIKVCGVEGPGSTTLNKIMEDYNLMGSASVFLKMDIEGSEWDAFLSASDSTMSSFSQIVCELHDLDRIQDDDFYFKILDCLTRIKQKFEVVHIHGNNHSPLLIGPGACSLPQTLEISFANRDVFSFEDSDDSYPTALDFPCHPKRADYVIEFIKD